MFGFGFYDVLIIAAFLGVQYFLSTRNHVYFGAIIPVIYTAWLTWMFATSRFESSLLAYILILLVGLAFLIEQWHQGRKSLRERRKKELEKMKSHDMI